MLDLLRELFFVPLSVGTKRPRRIKAIGCTVLLLLGTKSPVYKLRASSSRISLSSGISLISLSFFFFVDMWIPFGSNR
ncbi:hypothetical protein GNG23_27275 [Klebsiella pneumoniae]|nr:hypothetical protein [Klebsiella pneumoniae]